METNGRDCNGEVEGSEKAVVESYRGSEAGS